MESGDHTVKRAVNVNDPARSQVCSHIIDIGHYPSYVVSATSADPV